MREYIGKLTSERGTAKVSIDKLDAKILSKLDQNARIAINQLSKEIKSSREVVNYRIQRLEKKNILLGFLPLIDISKLGYTRRKIYFKLQDFSKEEEEKFIAFLTAMPEIIWVASCSGNWDLGIILCSKIDTEFEVLFGKVLHAGKKHIADYVIETEIQNINIGISKLLYRHVGIPYANLDIARETRPESTGFDEKDKLLLNLINRNSRETLVNLSKKTHMDIKTVQQRLKKLEEKKIIYGSMAQANLFQLGYHWHWILLRLRTMDSQTLAKIKEYAQQEPSIVWVEKMIGTWNLHLSVFTRDVAEFSEVLNKIRKVFADVLFDYTSLSMLNQYKYFTGVV